MANVEWRPIKGFEGYYEVSNSGLIKRLRGKRKHPIPNLGIVAERILACPVGNQGYRQATLTLSEPKIRKQVLVHMEVAKAFLGYVPNKGTVAIDHDDNNKLNNNADNLKIVTPRYNSAKDNGKRSNKNPGVSVRPDRPGFRVSIRIKGILNYLGAYEKECYAAKVYEIAVDNIDLYEGNASKFRSVLGIHNTAYPCNCLKIK